MSARIPDCPHCKQRCEVHAGVYLCAPCHWFGGQVGALGVPSPEKASDGPATPTDPSPCTHPRDRLRYICESDMGLLYRDYHRCTLCGAEVEW